MSILVDHQIRDRCLSPTIVKPMIYPFVDKPVREIDGKKVMSFGLSSAGYDVRIGNKFKIFTNINSSIIDPLNFDEQCLHDFEGEVCILPPHSYALAVSIEYFYIPKNIMVICLGKSTYARCFTGDTRISLSDGTTPTFLELIDRVASGERVWGYSVDTELNIVMSELTAPRKIGYEKILEVVLDNGEVVRCTPDHKFIVRNGLEIEARDLKAGDSLFPFYKTITSKGYEVVAQPKTWEYDFSHKLADDWNIRQDIYQYNENESSRHHIDHNKLNNTPSNIVRLTPSDHTKYHNEINNRTNDIRNKISLTQKKIWAEKSKDADWLEKRLEHLRHMTSIWSNDPSDSEQKKRHSNSLKKYWNSPEGLKAKEIARQRCRLMVSTDEARKRNSENLHNLWKDESFCQMMIEQCRYLNLRKDISEETLIDALETERSIRGAARKLNCDRSVFRRFKETVAHYKARWDVVKVTSEQFYHALCLRGSIGKAAQYLGIGKSTAKRHYKDAISTFYGYNTGDNHKVKEIREMDEKADVYCLTSAEFGNFALAAGVFVNNCGVIINTTPIEPEFEGQVVIEISNSTSLPAKIYANQGIAQFLFFEADSDCGLSYLDKKGKYQGQTGITYAKG